MALFLLRSSVALGIARHSTPQLLLSAGLSTSVTSRAVADVSAAVPSAPKKKAKKASIDMNEDEMEMYEMVEKVRKPAVLAATPGSPAAAEEATTRATQKKSTGAATKPKVSPSLAAAISEPSSSSVLSSSSTPSTKSSAGTSERESESFAAFAAQAEAPTATLGATLGAEALATRDTHSFEKVAPAAAAAAAAVPELVSLKHVASAQREIVLHMDEKEIHEFESASAKKSSAPKAAPASQSAKKSSKKDAKMSRAMAALDAAMASSTPFVPVVEAMIPSSPAATTPPAGTSSSQTHKTEVEEDDLGLTPRHERKRTALQAIVDMTEKTPLVTPSWDLLLHAFDNNTVYVPKILKTPAQACHRFTCLLREDIAEKIASMIDFKDKHVLELNPGPGVLSRALLRAGAKRVNAVDQDYKHQRALMALAKALDGRYKYLHGDIQKLDLSEGCPPTQEIMADFVKVPWEEECKSGVIVGIPPAKYGLRFFLSWLYKMSNRSGPFRFGRIPSYLLYPRYFVNKVLLEKGSRAQYRGAILTNIIADVKPLAYFNRQTFHPMFDTKHVDSIFDMTLIEVIPKKNTGLVDADCMNLDFVIRRLLAIKREPIRNGLNMLGPGGELLAHRAGVDPNLLASDLTLNQFIAIGNAFSQWEGKPNCYLEFDSDMSEGE